MAKDTLELFQDYKDIHEIKELIDEIKELRDYYHAQLYDEMQKHIRKLTQKYWMETLEWNAVNKEQPLSYEQAYRNAEMFLRTKGISVLVDKGIKDLQE